ncbi:MAG: hypothetical protein R6X14_03450 [bacterium]
MNCRITVVLLTLVALSMAAERTIKLDDKTFTLQVNLGGVRMVAEDTREPPGAYDVRSIPQSAYDEYGILPSYGGLFYESDSGVDGSWWYEGWQQWIEGQPPFTPHTLQAGGRTRRQDDPDTVYYIETNFAFRMNFMRWSPTSQYLHTGSIGHRSNWSYSYPKDTNKEDSQTFQWSDGYSRALRSYTGHVGYVDNQPGDNLWQRTTDRTTMRPNSQVRE